MKRKWVFVLILLIGASVFILYDTYPKWVLIDKDKKISQIPDKWKKIPIGIKINQLFTIIDTSLNAYTTAPEKADVWISHDKNGWFRLNVFRNLDSTVRGYSIDYYFGNSENYKFVPLTTKGSY